MNRCTANPIVILMFALLSLAMLGACANESDAPDATSESTQRATTQSRPEADDKVPSHVRDDGSVVIGDLILHPPAIWRYRLQDRPMRDAQFGVPGIDGADQADVTIHVFGPGLGGTTEENMQRWRRQFRTSEDVAPEGSVEVIDVDGADASLLRVEGRRIDADGSMLDDQAGVWIFMKFPARTVVFRMVGPKKTVAGHQQRLIKLAQTLEFSS